ncbi:hypothetical protein FDP41_011406 [Naegleria fowleri]|uniref:Uncharacterized protein n=1 Tax=Naegleria fowleri TaxID=5763 RepID=A0A6A5C401_NAEFO|nr:uncharacterized protein FDP41_011406 [Naegleria fowleri]KAF0982476.1 hypothetical protein FDP41_011406 [Naegleria fowleri]
MKYFQVVEGKLFCFHDHRSKVVSSDKQEIGDIREEWMEWNGENDFILSENYNVKQIYPPNCKAMRIFKVANVSLGLSQLFLLTINSSLELSLFVKAAGKMNEEWTKCLELKLSKFSQDSSSTIELVGFDGPSFLVKQDSQVYWITDMLTSTLQFEAMHLNLSNDGIKNRIIFSGHVGIDTKFWYTVFATDNNQFCVLKIPITLNEECSFETSSSSLAANFPLPPSSYSSICTCLTYCTRSDSSVITGVFGTLEKEVLFFNADSVTRCLKLSSIPVKIQPLNLNVRPVHEEYVLVHTSDRSLKLISILDLSIVKDQFICTPVMRALSTQIENTNNHIKQFENIKKEKQNLLRHQNRVTQEILDEFQKNGDSKHHATEDNGETQSHYSLYENGINVSFQNNKSLENNIFYDSVSDVTRMESRCSLSDTDIILKSASQALNTKYWDIRSCFMTKNDMDVILLPIPNTFPLQVEIFKNNDLSDSSQYINLTTRIEIPPNYADDDFSVKCLLIKRKPNSEKLFEYIGVLQPSVTEKLFGLKQSIKSNFADIQNTQLIFIMKHEMSSVDKSLRHILSEIFIDRLFMKNTNHNDYEYCSYSKGYISPLFYKVMIGYESTTCTESALICDILSDTTENMILVLTTIFDHLPENVIAIPSAFAENVMKLRKEVCVNINKEINHVIFKMHDHVKQSTMMNPREQELQQDLLEYLSLQIETDQSMLNLLDTLD